MMRIICDCFLATSPFRRVLQLNPQPCGYTYWQQTVVQGYHQAQGCIWSARTPFLLKIDLCQMIPTSYSSACTPSGSIFQICPLLPPAPASPQTSSLRNFELLLCGIPNPGIASSLPLATYCTCRSPFLAGTAIAVFKNKVFKTKQKSALYMSIGYSQFLKLVVALSCFTNI